jgi:hypothetical protein
VCGRKKLPFAGYSVVKEPSPVGDAQLASVAGGDDTPSTINGAKSGGEYRARTGDLLVANQALSQLS